MAAVRPLPTLDLAQQVTETPQGGGIGAPDVGLGRLAAGAEAFGQGLNRLIDAADVKAGQDRAAADAEAGTLSPKSEATVLGRAYNQVAETRLQLDRQAALTDHFGQIFSEYSDRPDELLPRLKASAAGFGKTGFPTVDTAMAGHADVQIADLMAKSYQAQHAKMLEVAHGNFVSSLQQAQDMAVRVALGAPFDAAGAARVAAQHALMQQGTLKFGPPEAFEANGERFEADPSRLGAMSAADLSKLWAGVDSLAKTTWIKAAQERLPTAEAQEAFAEDARKRYAAGDPWMKGWHPSDALPALDALDATATTTRNSEHAAMIQRGTEAEHLLQAWEWDGQVDPKAMVAAARASGNPALIAQAKAYASMPQESRGVLKTVMARRAGLIPEPGGQEAVGGAQPVAVDAYGRPVGGDGGAFPTAPDVRAALPGVTITSNLRTPAHNAAVGGVRNSYHLTGQAFDLTPRAGQSMSDLAAEAKRAFPGLRVLNEGNHVHVQPDHPAHPADAWTPPPSAAPGTPAFLAWGNLKEGFSTDPVKASMGSKKSPAVVPQPVLVLAAPFGNDPAAVAAWGQALAARQANAQFVSRTLGAPERRVTNAEADFYKDKISSDPTAAIALARQALPYLGPAKTTAFLRELGQDGGPGSVALHLGQLSLINPTFSAKVTTGLRLQASGAKPPAKVANVLPPGGRTLDMVERDVAPAFRFAPELLNAARKTADLAHLADSLSGTEGPAQGYFDAAVGGSVIGGRKAGGVGMVNGLATVLPHWLAQDRVGDALRVVGDGLAHNPAGPVFSNGKPMTGRDLAGLQLVMAPSGRYWLKSRGGDQRAMTRDGRPFELDLDGAREQVAAALPGADLRRGR